MKKVLITGSGGKIGRVLANGLKATSKYEIIATGHSANSEADITALSVDNLDACVEALKGVDTVIHGAYHMKNKGHEHFVDQQLQTNIIGAYNIYEAARIDQVKRVIFLSSNHVVGFYPIGTIVDENTPMRPDSFYGINKCFIEVLGNYYADRFGISCINLRIGHLNEEDKPWSPRRSRIFLSHRDCVSLLEKCIDADENLKKLTMYAASNNKEGYWDMGKYREIIGYEPQDDGYDYIEYATKTDRLNGEDDTEFLGGEFVTF